MPTALPFPVAPAPRERRVTGRVVLASLVGFFLVVAGANAVMITAAVSTFGGARTDSSYRAGQRYAAERAAMEAQDALHWTVDTTILTAANTAEDAEPERVVAIDAVDAAGAPIAGLTALVRLEHPADTRRDRLAATRSTGEGRFEGTVAAGAGQWDLVVELSKGEEIAFRSRRRIFIP